MFARVLGVAALPLFACGSVEGMKTDARVVDTPQNMIDAAIDAPGGACDPAKPFGAMTPVVEVNTAMEDQGGYLSADELTMFLATRPATASQIYVATRATTTAAFSTPVSAGAVNIGDSFSPSLTTDQLTMYLISNGTGTVGGHDVFVSTRSNTTAAFPAPTNVGNINSTNDNEYGVGVTGNGNELFFTSGRTGADRVYSSTKSGAGFGVPAIIAPIVDSNANTSDAIVALRTDGLELYFGSNRAGGLGAHDIWVTRRTSASAAWGAPVHVAELSSAQADFPSWVSADGCRVLVSSQRAGGKGNTDIWFAQRPK